VQGDFTLLAVTRGGPLNAVQAVPHAVPPGFVPPPFVTTVEGATGIWIGVRGGIGFRTLMVPNDGRRHVYPFGAAALVVDESDARGTAFGWNGPDGVSRVAEGVPPYGLRTSWAAASPGHPAGPYVTLIPCRLADHFTVAAEPLDAAGRALGRPVFLLCQSVTPQVLFAQFPASYSARTQQFRVTAARRGAGPGATWRLAGLPPATRNGPDDPPPATVAGFGPLTIRAAAAEAEDFSGYPDWWNRHPPRDAGGGWSFSQPLNADQHEWTGVPCVRFLLAARNLSRDTLRQNWVVEIDRVSPQWSGPRVMPSTAATMPLDVFPVYNPQNLSPGSAWVTHDWQVGAAYPGQHHWVKIDGAALRSAWRTETVTLHDAEVVHDAGFGGDRVVWRHPETVTTPSGISVTVLNGRVGMTDQGAGPPGAPVWGFTRGSAEMLLAWHLPPGFVSQEHAAFNDPHEAEAPRATGTLGSEWDTSRPMLRGALTVPDGGMDGAALERAGYTPLRFSLNSNKWQPLPPPSARHGGLSSLEAVPLLPHLKTITLRIGLREEQERHPFHLWVPVRAAFPPGWDADAADGRSRGGP